MPAVWTDPVDSPCFLVPVSADSPWSCHFHYVRRDQGRWLRTPVAPANNTWDGCALGGARSGDAVAYVVTGEQDGSALSYGGGMVEEWRSVDEGASWEKGRDLVPEEGLIYNNPKLVEASSGDVLDGTVVFYGWQGPGSIQVQTGSLVADGSHRIGLPDDGPTGNRGQAYLWHDGEWL
jgi:hypothetical protein